MSDQSPVLEQWRPYPGFGRYEVSSLGGIRNRETRRPVATYRNVRTRDRFAVLYGDGGRKASVRTAPLFAQAFLGPRPESMQIDHVNGDKGDERMTNLEYVSQSENVRRSYQEQDLHPVRVSRGYSLTAEQYERVFELCRQGLNQCQIGRQVGCDNSTVSKILSGRIRCRHRTGPAMKPAPLHVQRGRERLGQVRLLMVGCPGLSAREVAGRLGVSKAMVMKYRAAIRRERAVIGVPG